MYYQQTSKRCITLEGDKWKFSGFSPYTQLKYMDTEGNMQREHLFYYSSDNWDPKTNATTSFPQVSAGTTPCVRRTYVLLVFGGQTIQYRSFIIRKREFFKCWEHPVFMGGIFQISHLVNYLTLFCGWSLGAKPRFCRCSVTVRHRIWPEPPLWNTSSFQLLMTATGNVQFGSEPSHLDSQLWDKTHIQGGVRDDPQQGSARCLFPSHSRPT